MFDTSPVIKLLAQLLFPLNGGFLQSICSLAYSIPGSTGK